MSAMSMRFADSTHKRLREFAQKEHISISQFVNSAVLEKMAALATLEYLEERAKLGNKERFHAVLAKVPNGEPREDDKYHRMQPESPSEEKL